MLGLVLVCALAALVWFWKPLNGYAVAGASYGAQLGCACRHIAGRTLSACRADFEEGMGPIMLSEDEATAIVPAIARNRNQAQIVRSFLKEHETPPASTFDPQIGKGA